MTLLLRAGPAERTIESRWDVTSMDQLPAGELNLNDIGAIRIRLAEPVAADPYLLNRSTGSFLLVDEPSGATVAAGLIR